MGIEKSPNVQKAIYLDDRDALSRMGRKGAERREENKIFKETEEKKNMDDAAQHEQNMIKDLPPDDL